MPMQKRWGSCFFYSRPHVDNGIVCRYRAALVSQNHKEASSERVKNQEGGKHDKTLEYNCSGILSIGWGANGAVGSCQKHVVTVGVGGDMGAKRGEITECIPMIYSGSGEPFVSDVCTHMYGCDPCHSHDGSGRGNIHTYTTGGIHTGRACTSVAERWGGRRRTGRGRSILEPELPGCPSQPPPPPTPVRGQYGGKLWTNPREADSLIGKAPRLSLHPCYTTPPPLLSEGGGIP